MTVVNSKEFATNQKKYYDLAVNEDVVIKRGKNIFHLMCAGTNSHSINKYDDILEPDEDFYSALSADEFRKRLIEVIEKVDNKYANR